MKCVVLNDTSNQRHHGCVVVMKALFAMCEEHGTEVTATNFVGTDWKKNSKFVDSLKKCDLVLINGEGTIHHGSRWGFVLLEAGLFAKTLGKRVFLINAVWQENPEAFSKIARTFDGVFVRESFSKEQLQLNNVAAKVVPDLSFYAKFPDLETSRERSGIMFTDGVDKDLSVRMWSIANRNKLGFVPVTYPKSGSKVDRVSYAVRAYDKKRVVVHPVSYLRAVMSSLSYSESAEIDEKVFFQLLGEQSLVITARFHALCFLVRSETPFLCLWSNSFKMQGLLADLGLRIEDYRIKESELDSAILRQKLEGGILFGPDWVEKIKRYKVSAKLAYKKMCKEIF